jgi:hypothetical protein
LSSVFAVVTRAVKDNCGPKSYFAEFPKPDGDFTLSNRNFVRGLSKEFRPKEKIAMVHGTNRQVCRRLPSGEDVHLIRFPSSELWGIKSVDQSWFEYGNVPPLGTVPRMFWTKTLHAESVGWQDKRFETADAAFAFVAEHLPLVN